MKFFPACTLLLLSALGGFAQSPQIHTDRPAPLALTLPDQEQSFHFVVFGDRTSGVPEGIRILEKAVTETNLIAPDLVMTIGDMVQGYTNTETWLTQMNEYRGVMEKLRMPWFPVAGNHDIYWRGDGRPLTEHEGSYEKHFGPLWYWFAHKGSGFLVLFSDEGDLVDASKRRSFNDPAQQKFSDRQLTWIRKSLEEMKDLKNVFVFMHQPRWDMDRYPGSNWADVQKLLAAHGGVKACFAGHIHRMRFDGVKDGIQFHTLATTGGSSAGHYPDVGYLHHINMVSVRKGGVHISTVPVGVVMDPKLHTAERAKQATLARRMKPDAGRGFTLDANGKGSAPYPLRLSNPTRYPLEVTLGAAGAKGWKITPETRTVVVKPGEEPIITFDIECDGAGFEGKFRVPTLKMDLHWIEGEKRSQLPGKKFPVEITLGQLPDEVFHPADQPVAVHLTDRESAMKVESSSFNLPDGPFTLECRVNPEQVTESSGIVAKTQNSEYGFITSGDKVSFLLHLGGRYVRLHTGPVLEPGKWIHLAGVYDGKEARLYVDGKQVAAASASGPRTRNNLPLYIGADTNADGQPSRSFLGWVDEVRLSKGALYNEGFTPDPHQQVTGDTVLMYHADRMIGGRLPDQSSSRAHAVPVGKAVLKAFKN